MSHWPASPELEKQPADRWLDGVLRTRQGPPRVVFPPSIGHPDPYSETPPVRLLLGSALMVCFALERCVDNYGGEERNHLD